MFELTSGKRLDQAKSRYQEVFAEVSQLVRESGNDRERHVVAETHAREHTFANSANSEKIQAETAKLEAVRWQILCRMPEFLMNVFKYLVDQRASMNDQIQVKQLIESGKLAVANEVWDQLDQINARLWNLMP